MSIPQFLIRMASGWPKITHRSCEVIIEFPRTVLSTTSTPSGSQTPPKLPKKWDEQVGLIGETVPHEKEGASPYRGSSTQQLEGRDDDRDSTLEMSGVITARSTITAKGSAADASARLRLGWISGSPICSKFGWRWKRGRTRSGSPNNCESWVHAHPKCE